MLMRIVSALPKAALFAMPLSPMLMAHGGSGAWEKRGAFALNIGAFVLFALFPVALWLPALGFAAWGGAFWCGVLAVERKARERALDKEWKRWEKIARSEKWKGRARMAVSKPAGVASNLAARAADGLASMPRPKLPSLWSRRNDKTGSADDSRG